MFKLAKHRVVHVWIAMLAVLFGALAPAVSHALAAAHPQSGEILICTMDGVKPMLVDAGGALVPPQDMSDNTPDSMADHMFKHCGYCLAQAGSPALLPPHGFVIAAAMPANRYPPLFYRSTRALFPWTAANPRAPPAAA